MKNTIELNMEYVHLHIMHTVIVIADLTFPHIQPMCYGLFVAC